MEEKAMKFNPYYNKQIFLITISQLEFLRFTFLNNCLQLLWNLLFAKHRKIQIP